VGIVLFQFVTLLPLPIVAVVLAVVSGRRKRSLAAFAGWFAVASLPVTVALLVMPYGPFLLPAIVIALRDRGDQYGVAAINTGMYLMVGLLAYRFTATSIWKAIVLTLVTTALSCVPFAYTVAFPP